MLAGIPPSMEGGKQCRWKVGAVLVRPHSAEQAKEGKSKTCELVLFQSKESQQGKVADAIWNVSL